MASGESSLDSNGSGGGGSHGYLSFSTENPIRSSNVSPREYDPLTQQQYDPMNSLRRQNEMYRTQILNLRNKLDLVLQEKQRVEREFDHIKKDGIDKRVYFEQFNEIKVKYNNIRKEKESLIEEIEMVKQSYEKIKNDFKTSSMEKNDLIRQLTTTFQQLEIGQKQEKSLCLDKARLENMVLDKNREISTISLLLQELRQESKLTLDERDTVLKENQKLTDECLIATTQIKKLEKDNKSIKHESECLKQEIQSAYAKCNSFKEQIDHIKSRPEFKNVISEGWSTDLSENKDKYTSDQHELDLQTANREIEKLKKALDKVTSEVTKSAQEIDIAKGRRDWAISEREKIVQERDSIKTLCDELRKERDTAISDLLAAIRDSENIKKQKDEAYKEVEQLKEHLESQVTSNSTVLDTSWNYNNYETNFVPNKSLDTDIIDVDMHLYSNDEDDDLGLVLDDNRNELQNNQGNNITVLAVSKDSIFTNKLQKNDVIIRVNNIDCLNISKRYVFDEIRNSTNRCTFVVKRQRSIKKHVYTTQLNVGSNNNHGLTLETGVYISKIVSGSLAALDKNLAVGDRILSINNHSMEIHKNRNEAMTLLDNNYSDVLTIIGLKQMASKNKMSVKQNNTATQTDDNLNHSFDLENSRNFLQSANAYYENTSSAFPVTTTSNKSTSKITEMIQKFRDKITQKSSETDAAIAVLDSVIKDDIQSNIPTKDNGVIKRSKKKSKESNKDNGKGMETWPRANIIELNHNTGTIVHHRKKERPALSAFTAITSNKNNVDSTSNEDYFNVTSSLSSQKPQTSSNNSNRNSNPIPYQFIPPPAVFNRHSVYQLGNMKQFPLPGVSNISHIQKSSEIDQSNHHHRMSLNLTQTDAGMYANKNAAMARLLKTVQNQSYQHQQVQNQPHSMDFMPLKNQNSIESFLNSNSKGPPPIDYLSKQQISKDINNLDYFHAQQRKQTKNVTKYPSDSESLGLDMTSPVLNSNNSISSYSRVCSVSPKSVGLFPQYPPQYPPQYMSHGHSHQHTARLASPPTLHEDNIGLSMYDRYGFDSYATPSPYHTHVASMDYPSDSARPPILRERDDHHGFVYTNGNFRYEGGTFPRKKEQRLRIPSNTSVTSKGSGVKNSTGSIEHHGSERGSPMPTFQVEVLSHGSNANKRNSMPDYMYGQKPNPGDLRRVTIDKSVEPLGITIRCNNNGGGIFVSTVTKNSIASQVGLQIGDQLLEICGINMRAATSESAKRVLRQCGNSITMLVQYSPEKYDGEIEQSSDDQSISHSGSPTPRNSPRQPRSFVLKSNVKQPTPILQSNLKTLTLPAQVQLKEFSGNLINKTDSTGSFNRNSIFEEEPRVLFIETKKSPNLGINLTGGNACGIFVNNVEKDCLAYNAGMRVGDQILEYNGVDLRHVTAEQAAMELAKPADDRVTVIVQYNFKKFKQIKDLLGGGDSFYIRVGFDRTGDLGDAELRFTKDEVLLVDDTMIGRGQWRAWKLDDYGTPLKCGRILSQLKVEEELRLQGNISDGDAQTRRGSTSARRSFFRRRKHHRSSSRDSKELASFSNTQLSCHSDSGILSDEGLMPGYQRVERLDYPVRRPLLVLGPLADWVVDKLTNDFSLQFKCCSTTTLKCDEETVENMIKNNTIVGYKMTRNTQFEVTTVKAIKDVCDKNRHCILDIDLSGVERLQRMHIFPIVLLLRFKSAKQIKEIKDSRFINDKISAKAAKEMYEHSLKLLTDYKHLISAVIPAGVNITHICTQIKDAVEKEQEKILWVPSSTA